MAPGFSRARIRLTALYASLFAASSAVLLLAVNLITRHTLPNVLVAAIEGRGGRRGSGRLPPVDVIVGPTDGMSTRVISVANAASLVSSEILRWSLLVFVVTLLLSVLLGFLLAGRVLRPIQRAFDSERRLVASMSHELRTPLATQRVLLETALLGEDSPAGIVAAKVLDENIRAGRIIDAMLTLARTRSRMVLGREASARKHADEEPGANRLGVAVDLSSVVRSVLVARATDAQALNLRIRPVLARPAMIVGDPTLLERLVDTLISNAVTHNVMGGSVEVTLRIQGPHLVLVVANSGPVIAPNDVAALTLPFRRGARDRTQSDRGTGLGLTIAAEVVEYHHGTISLAANPSGGLTVRVQLDRSGTRADRA